MGQGIQESGRHAGVHRFGIVRAVPNDKIRGNLVMAEATHKHDVINKALGLMWGRDRVATIAADLCMTCGGAAKVFRDELSRREYTISGMCQACQDSIFGGNDSG